MLTEIYQPIVASLMSVAYNSKNRIDISNVTDPYYISWAQRMNGLMNYKI